MALVARIGLGRLRAGIALGVRLARTGPMAVVALVLSMVTVVALSIVGVVLGRRGGNAPVHDIPLIASSAIAWGAGFLQAFAAASGALRRDRSTGIRHLYRTRATSVRGYLMARVGGLAAWLLALVGGGTVLIGAVVILGATRAQGISRSVQATVASIVFSVAFAAVIAPVAFAALGARSRMSGYLALLAVIVVPELLVSLAGGTAPGEVTELCAVPSALAALRASLAPGTVDVARFLRAVVALAVFVGVAMFFVRRDVLLLEREQEVRP